MNLKAERRLKFDRRLQQRVGWVTPGELAAELESLPDVSSKVWVEEPRAATDPQTDAPGSGARTQSSETPGSA
jgi:hypothetical protein